MSGGRPPAEVRRWEARVRALAEPATRRAAGACVVEGIRAVRAAFEAGLGFEAVLVCPERLRSPLAWETVDGLAARGVARVDLPSARFARLSDMDNPVGLAAIVAWAPRPLAALPPPPAHGLYVLAEDLGDPGNLGTLLRTADAAGAAAVIVAGQGTDPGHRRCLRASLGSAFHLPVAQCSDPGEALAWARRHGVATLATSAAAATAHWHFPYRLPLLVALGNEERGLRPATLAACEAAVRIPMAGAADSLNVAVAAGIVLYEARRPRGAPPDAAS